MKNVHPHEMGLSIYDLSSASLLHESTSLPSTTFRFADSKWMAETGWANPESLHHEHQCLNSPMDLCNGVRVASWGSQSCSWMCPWATSLLQLRNGPGHMLLPAAIQAAREGAMGYASRSHGREGQRIKTAGGTEPSPWCKTDCWELEVLHSSQS